ncbi:hypothetical protein PAXRUDRAFT_16264 [Paxillus rubicundulus Ve08.2h10]|uniref:Uncharacterized protein n=1 Tax=Paxillus rubicundulus Ve08.2h10 TaxID=930991 RepID=A0A0D0D7B7_9AGAM|nr:hypothetical protein PAXRUDRAFT_16264 [Paxillus rubicundulus Ve08.2h10]
MFSSATNDLTKWSDEQLHEHNNDDKLYKRKSEEHRSHMKAWNEAEHWRAKGEVRQKAEEEAKHKAEVKAWRRAEMEAKAHREEIAQAQSSVMDPSKGRQLKLVASRAGRGTSPMLWMLRCEQLGDLQPTWWRKQEELMLLWAWKMKVQMQSPVVDEEEDEEEDEEAEEVEEDHNVLDKVDAGHPGGNPDPEFTPEEPEVGFEGGFEEEEVVEATKEREALNGQSEEEAEVDESV